MIVPIGGKFVSCHSLSAHRDAGPGMTVIHSPIMDTADSGVEAFERAMRVALQVSPKSAGWRDHHVVTKDLTGIESVGRIDFDQIQIET